MQFYIVFFKRGIDIAMKLEDSALSLLAIGISLAVSFQALFHIMVVTGLAPTTGIPLPFISPD